MVGLTKQKIELGSVYFELIDLLVFEPDSANECSGTAQLSRCHAQAVVRGQRPVLGKP